MTDPDIAFVEEVAREAGAILLDWKDRLPRIDKKGARDLVTAADRAAEEHVLARLRERFPDDAYLAEESAPEKHRAPRQWIIDPLDGTTNFVYGIPHFAVSIAWCEEGVPRVGCVFNPELDECWTAVSGEGARRGGETIAIRGETMLGDALLATGLGYVRNQAADSNLEHIVDFGYAARCLRRLGSAASDLCYVADGRVDGYWELHLSPWDVAAGGLIAREAGALVCDFEGGDDWLFGGALIAAHPDLVPEIRRVLAAADPARLPGPDHRPA